MNKRFLYTAITLVFIPAIVWASFYHTDQGAYRSMEDGDSYLAGEELPFGTKMYVTDKKFDNAFQWELSTPYNLSTGYVTDHFVIPKPESSGIPRDITWNPDGTKVFVVDIDNANIKEYNVSTPWDLTTVSYTDNLDVLSRDDAPSGQSWNPDGTKMYFVGSEFDNIYEYDVSPAWDVSEATFVDSLDVSPPEYIPAGITWNPDGTKMFLLGDSYNNIYEYNVSTPFDVSTSTISDTFSIESEDDRPQGFAWKPDGTKIFMAGKKNNNIYAYNVSTPFDIMTATFGDSIEAHPNNGAPSNFALESYPHY